MFRTFGRFAAGIMAAFVGIIIVTFAIADDLNNPPTSGLTVESDPIFTASSNLFYRSSNPSNYVTASVTNGLLTSYSETDPAFVSASNLFLQVEADTVALQTGAVLQTQIDELANTTWQDAVIDVDLATPPVSPTTGDRYVVATGGTGAWATKDKNIAQYNGSGWDFTAPVLGMGVNETDSGNDYRYNGSVWTLLTGPAPAKSVSVQESDGSPAIAGATKIVVPNGSLTKSGTTATFNWLTSAVTTAVSTNLAAGIPTVVGSELRVGTNSTSGAYQMFSSQVSTNGNYTMQVADIGKLFSWTVSTNISTFSLTNANLFASGQAIGMMIDAGTTNTLANKLNLIPATGDTINSVTNLSFAVQHDSVILVSDGVSKWNPISLINAKSCYYKDTTSVSVNELTEHPVVFDESNAANYDSGDFHSTSSNNTKFYFRQSGFYFIRFQTTHQTNVGNAGDYCIPQLYLNGDNTKVYLDAKEYRPVGSANNVLYSAGVIYLSTGDYVELVLYHNRAADTSAVSFKDNIMSITKIQ